ncbi:MAG TPA: DNA-formamidopyrimidine glycosylase [Anaerolineaceae bacterium]|nr:DNA-formamidopyrimidine glycosylase [Anaerolineaceae bacterium]
MPELPEVETIARTLREGKGEVHSILEHTIEHASVLWERSIATPSIPEFLRRIQGQVVQHIGRRGKYIVMTLSEDTLLVHLRMSGDVRVEQDVADVSSVPLKKHDRVVFYFQENERLVFEDARKFGRLWLLADPQVELGKLGPEPLSEELTPAEFATMLRQHKRQLKPLLMDQTFLAGLGNIYTDEALFKAKLHPLMVAQDLNFEQAGALLIAIKETLQEGIRRNGASIDWVYRGGDFQNQFFVYGRKDKPCLVCGTPIERLVVGQRSTHICPQCQVNYQEDIA